MSRSTQGLAIAFAFMVLTTASGQEKPAAEEKPATYKVTAGPFKIEVTAKGTFEAAKMTEVRLRPEAVSTLVVDRAVPQGTRVKQGDLLVALETKKLDEQIRDLKAGRDLAVLGIELAEKELRFLKESQPLDLAGAERSNRIAVEDLARFDKVDRPRSEKSAEFSKRDSRNYLEQAEEELRQLEKMYKADDLTEETEEIILKRARYSVERARYSLESALISADRTINVTLPRRKEELTDAARREALSLQKLKITAPLLMSQKQMQLEKLLFDRRKADEQLAKLQKDRRAMVVKSPAAGVVYYGRCLRGQWTTASTVAAQLRPGGKLTANLVFMTIVEPKDLFVRVDLEEKDLVHIRRGVEGKVVPTAFPDTKLAAEVGQVSLVPVKSGTFDARVTIAGEGARVMPGMTCSVKLVPYAKADALTVPKSAVFSDEADDEKQYVYLSGKDGKPTKQVVKTGKSTKEKVEILDGLKEGDVILGEKPKS